jgi:hypothetical protein
MKKSVVYAFYVESHHAIKVGFGDDGKRRMYEYSKTYGLQPKASSLRTWEIPIAALESIVEAACHSALINSGLNRVKLGAHSVEPQELFDLSGIDYDEALLLVTGTIDETMREIAKRIAPTSVKSDEQKRQSEEQNRVRRTEVKRKKLADLERQAKICSDAILLRWKMDFVPFINSCNIAQQRYREFPSQQTFFQKLTGGEKDRSLRMRDWEHYPDIKKSVFEIFKSARVTKAAYVDIRLQLSSEILSLAEINLGISLSSPGKHSLPLISYGIGREDIAFLEVRLAV